MESVDNRLKSTRVLGLFAKEPVPGQVKTRLTPPLSTVQAATLYQTALIETVETMRGGDFELVICYTGNPDYFRQAFPGVKLYEQQGDDLGKRMENALNTFFQQGYQQAMLIGSDSPDLPPALVKQAYAALDRHPLVLVPAYDGGYVLIGESFHSPQLFENIPWSSDEVISLTRKRAEQSGIDYFLLSGWDDLDDLDALQRFLRRSPQSKTAEYLCGLSVAEGLTATS